jgi:hypothetical protein
MNLDSVGFSDCSPVGCWSLGLAKTHFKPFWDILNH